MSVTPEATSFQPYWWSIAAPEPAAPVALAARYDVAIVGSGFTGLHAAVELLRAGHSVVILEREDPGFGASRRNAGYLGRAAKKTFSHLRHRHGTDYALAVYRELGEAFRSTVEFIATEGIECNFHRCGRYIAASSRRHYDELAAELEVMAKALGYQYSLVPRSRQREEFASDIYYGGAVIPDLASIHPGLYHKGLLALVLRLGGVVSGRTDVLGIEPGKNGVALATGRGPIQATDAIIATNGYTPRQFAWHARRLVPFTGYMAATELLPEDLLASIIPARRTVLDTNTNIDFFRPAPDSPRLLFGGDTGCGLTEDRAIEIRLCQILTSILPQLAGIRLANVWTGLCAGTFDMMPHIGGQDRVWYAMGYNYAGVPMGGYLGAKLAYKILGRAEGESVFGRSKFPTLPFYRGNAWFTPLVMRYFDLKDGKKRRTSAASQNTNHLN